MTARFHTFLLFFVFTLLGFFGGYYLGNHLPQSTLLIGQGNQTIGASIAQGSYKEGYQAAMSFARKRLMERGLMPSDTIPITTFNATVQSIAEGELMVDHDPSAYDVLAETMITQKVVIQTETQLIEQVPKSSAEAEKELTAFNKALQMYVEKLNRDPENAGAPPQDPQSYTIKDLNLSDLKAGDLVQIYSAGDIRSPAPLIASKIVVRFRALVMPLSLTGDSASSKNP